MTFTVIETGKVSLWERTTELRMFSEFVQKPPRLQQAWRERHTGEYRWRDIETVYEQPLTNPLR